MFVSHTHICTLTHTWPPARHCVLVLPGTCKSASLKEDCSLIPSVQWPSHTLTQHTVSQTAACISASSCYFTFSSLISFARGTVVRSLIRLLRSNNVQHNIQYLPSIINAIIDSICFLVFFTDNETDAYRLNEAFLYWFYSDLRFKILILYVFPKNAYIHTYKHTYKNNTKNVLKSSNKKKVIEEVSLCILNVFF